MREGEREGGREMKLGEEDEVGQTSGAIQGKVPTRESFVVCWWNFDEPKSQI